MTALSLSYREAILLTQILNRYLSDHPCGENVGFAALLLGRLKESGKQKMKDDPQNEKKPAADFYELDPADIGL